MIDLDPHVISKYALLIFITILYYIISYYLVKLYGLPWIAVVWSFPLLLLWLFLFNTKCSCDSSETIGYFILATVILLLVLVVAWLLCSMNKYDNETILVLSLAVWLLLSVVFLYYIYK